MFTVIVISLNKYCTFEIVVECIYESNLQLESVDHDHDTKNVTIINNYKIDLVEFDFFFCCCCCRKRTGNKTFRCSFPFFFSCQTTFSVSFWTHLFPTCLTKQFSCEARKLSFCVLGIGFFFGIARYHTFMAMNRSRSDAQCDSDDEMDGALQLPLPTYFDPYGLNNQSNNNQTFEFEQLTGDYNFNAHATITNKDTKITRKTTKGNRKSGVSPIKRQISRNSNSHLNRPHRMQPIPTPQPRTRSQRTLKNKRNEQTDLERDTTAMIQRLNKKHDQQYGLQSLGRHKQNSNSNSNSNNINDNNRNRSGSDVNSSFDKTGHGVNSIKLNKIISINQLSKLFNKKNDIIESVREKYHIQKSIELDIQASSCGSTQSLSNNPNQIQVDIIGAEPYVHYLYTTVDQLLSFDQNATRIMSSGCLAKTIY